MSYFYGLVIIFDMKKVCKTSYCSTFKGQILQVSLSLHPKIYYFLGICLSFFLGVTLIFLAFFIELTKKPP